MCTVSFVKTADKIVITSNRDESVIRLNAIHPQVDTINNKKVIYPKDPKAGGTWYVVDEKGTVLVLLNGADEKHQVQPPYRKSRGLIVLDMIGSDSPKQYWDEMDLDNIEPFTLVLYQEGLLFQLRWNGVLKSKVSLDVNQKHIWASSTLYPLEIRNKRELLFQSFLEEKQTFSETDMYHFHRYSDKDNPENGLVINRNDLLKTLSITQAVVSQGQVAINHYDLIHEKEYASLFAIS